MDILNDLRATWQTADTNGLPDAGAITAIAKTYRNKKLALKIRIVIFSIAMAIFFALMMYHDRVAMVSTLIGEGLFVLCLVILGYTNLRSIKRFLVLNDASNADFIGFLEQTKRNQAYYYQRTQVVAMLLYSLAILFYLFELAHKNTWFMLGMYILTIGALLVFWLVVRPKVFKKESEKLQKMIDHAERLAQQLK